MALGDPYATVGDLKAYLGIEDADDDALLEPAIEAASRGIEQFCRRQFNQATVATARVFPAGGCRVKVDDFHTTTGLVVATGSDGVYDTTWAASDYELEPLNGVVDGVPGWPYNAIRTLSTGWPTCTGRGRAHLQVTAQWGWAEVPTPVYQACLIIAAECFKLKDAPFGVAGFGEYGMVRVRSNPMTATMLAAYRRDPVMVG